ncbi:RNA polymerase sigma-70 factor (ECF subfamily) [Haloferula luteola]|uniref:RNA polymerase sigma-70 factor (ECF subfamily) n=1 Tax=Haloferula luteola TaxID=595692 RepID=A0A840V090_9BACT|nr:sigma-70 family RNA polymerase sigma factor [Haloferula luteola]MBB5350703.1 RNA polymerase sigma-70 factor (ECF subfamily) [Haloferula luteola]
MSDADSMNSYTMQLIALQSELRVFIHHLAPYYAGTEDVLQEVNMLLLEKRSKFTPGTHFKAWAFRFARNVMMNHLRKLKRERQFVFSLELVETLAEEHENEPDDRQQRMGALSQCLKNLDDDHRELLLSRYRKYGAIAEAADASALTASGLRARIHRLRIALRRCIEQKLNPASPA